MNFKKEFVETQNSWLSRTMTVPSTTVNVSFSILVKLKTFDFCLIFVVKFFYLIIVTSHLLISIKVFTENLSFTITSARIKPVQKWQHMLLLWYEMWYSFHFIDTIYLPAFSFSVKWKEGRYIVPHNMYHFCIADEVSN